MEKEKKPIIGIATHAHSVIDFDMHFNHSVMLERWGAKHDISMLGYKGLMAADARELSCNVAIEQGCTHIFFLDADHIIPEETMDYLLESKDEAIVSGLICRRFYPFEQVVWGKIDRTDTYVAANLKLDGNIYEVGVCAFGCTLINLEKLKELEKPWFRDTCKRNDEGNLRNVRSDINICNLFRANGEKVWIDTRILVGHAGVNLIVYPQNADDLKNFHHQYQESFKLREGQVGKYKTLSRIL